MIEKNEIALLHGAEIVPGLIAPDSSPRRLTIPDEISP